MKKENQKWIIVIPLSIILIVIGVLIIVRKNNMPDEQENDTQNEISIVNTVWDLDRTEVITSDGTADNNDYVHLRLEFFENTVSVCVFYETSNHCSTNKYTKEGDNYIIEKDDLTNAYGTVKFDDNGNIYLEQQTDANYKTIYYFKKNIIK